ncbi:hypothetical protein VE25_04575 [Devosia geojensis]|uniref:GH16 domain-containing protein n=1 Tax=Devosia geojensis TaxID=443610 RepID=A0A0F5FXL0_9HYPH|nr:family 16 glycosylhydrolase [Devosia geojensis]KKB12927.1 hypothetical protein VE25_04575 [Devosia geojensis]
MTRVQSSRRAAYGLACLALPLSAAAQAQESFFDTFYTLNQQRWYVSDGWANGPHQNCLWSAGQVTTGQGKLRIGFAAIPAGDRSYSCGEIQTKQAFGHGTFEASVKTPAGSGLNAAFFTYIGPAQGSAHDEIDFEILTKDTRTVETTTFVNGRSGDGLVGSGEKHALPHPSNWDYIDYAVTWEPNEVRFYVDKQLIRTITDPAMIPNNPQRIFFSLWGSDTLVDWMGPFEPPVGPISMQVDWVAYTALGEGCAFEASVLCAEAN